MEYINTAKCNLPAGPRIVQNLTVLHDLQLGIREAFNFHHTWQNYKYNRVYLRAMASSEVQFSGMK